MQTIDVTNVVTSVCWIDVAIVAGVDEGSLLLLSLIGHQVVYTETTSFVVVVTVERTTTMLDETVDFMSNDSGEDLSDTRVL